MPSHPIYESRCNIHEKPDQQFYKKVSSDCGPNSIVRANNGANPDLLSMYSTTKSTTHLDWLPALQSKFKLHLNSSPKEFIRAARKQQTGYSKNCSNYVEYDKKVDESYIKFSDERFITQTQTNYKAPIYADKNQTVGPYISETAFTRFPSVSFIEDVKPRQNVDTKSNAQSVDHKAQLKPSIYDKSNIIPSESAFTTDVGHIKSFGVSTESPFKKLSAPSADDQLKWPKQMNPDGFTRSVSNPLGNPPKTTDGILSKDILDKIQHSDPTKWIQMHEMKNKSTSNYIHCDLNAMGETMKYHQSPHDLGPKQETGSIRNNHPFVWQKDDDSKSRYMTETSEQFRDRPFPAHSSQSNHISRSGFTMCNKYNYVHPARSEESTLKELHPSVARYKSRQLYDLYSSRPTQPQNQFWKNDRVAHDARN